MTYLKHHVVALDGQLEIIVFEKKLYRFEASHQS